MGSSQSISSSQVKELTQICNNVSVSVITNCTNTTKVTQSQTANLNGMYMSNSSINMSQTYNTTINASCASNASTVSSLASKISASIQQSLTAVAGGFSLGPSSAATYSSTQIDNYINNTINVQSVTNLINTINGQQNQTLNANGAYISNSSISMSQKATLAIFSKGLANAITKGMTVSKDATTVSQKSSSTVKNAMSPLTTMFSSMFSSVTNSIMYVVIFIVVIITAIIIFKMLSSNKKINNEHVKYIKETQVS